MCSTYKMQLGIGFGVWGAVNGFLVNGEREYTHLLRVLPFTENRSPSYLNKFMRTN